MEIRLNQQNPSFLKTMHQPGQCTMISLQDAWNTKCLDFRVWMISRGFQGERSFKSNFGVSVVFGG